MPPDDRDHRPADRRDERDRRRCLDHLYGPRRRPRQVGQRHRVLDEHLHTQEVGQALVDQERPVGADPPQGQPRLRPVGHRLRPRPGDHRDARGRAEQERADRPSAPGNGHRTPEGDHPDRGHHLQGEQVEVDREPGDEAAAGQPERRTAPLGPRGEPDRQHDRGDRPLPRGVERDAVHGLRREHQRQARDGRASRSDGSAQHVVGQADEDQVPDQRHDHERERRRTGDGEGGGDQRGVERGLVARTPQEPRPLAVQDVQSLQPDDRRVGVHAAGVDERRQPGHDRGDEQQEQRQPGPEHGRAAGPRARRAGPRPRSLLPSREPYRRPARHGRGASRPLRGGVGAASGPDAGEPDDGASS